MMEPLHQIVEMIKGDVDGDDEIIVFSYTMVILYGGDFKSPSFLRSPPNLVMGFYPRGRNPRSSPDSDLGLKYKDKNTPQSIQKNRYINIPLIYYINIIYMILYYI